MVNVTLYGTKSNLQKYCKALQNRLQESVSVVEQRFADVRESQVIISIKSGDLLRSDIDVEGFKNVGLSAKDFVEPYILEYSKMVGQSSMQVQQINLNQDETLGDYEDLESYDIRMGKAYVG